LTSCPLDDYLENSSTNTCDKRNKINVTIILTEINNPYTFLVVFWSSQTLNVTIQKNLREQLVINSTISILDNREYSYGFIPSNINSTSFILEMTYPNKTNTNSSSSMELSFQNSDNPYFEPISLNFSLDLLNDHDCDPNTQYFNNQTQFCMNKFMIDFSWSYGAESNIILLPFNDLNSGIGTAIINESLLCLSIDTLTYPQDYLYSFINNSNTMSIIFQYKKEIIGGVYLHLSLNQSVYTNINLLNQTAYLQNRNYDIKLLDYYFLSEAEQKTINGTATMTTSGSQASLSGVYAAMFLFPGASFAI
jgi:hypothetical protein